MRTRIALSLAALVAAASHAAAQTDPAAQRGLVFAKTHCAQCHAIGRVDESPLKTALPLREMPLRYPPDLLPGAMHAGIERGHPNMPAFMLDAAQLSDLIAYLRHLGKP